MKKSIGQGFKHGGPEASVCLQKNEAALKMHNFHDFVPRSMQGC